MGRTIFDKSQITDEVIEFRRLVDPRDGYFEWEEFTHPSNPTQLWTTEGTFSALSGVDRGLDQWASGAIAGNRAHIDRGDTANSIRNVGGADFIHVFRIRDDTAIQESVFVGMGNNIPTAAVPSGNSPNALYFRKLSGAANANWFAVARLSDVETSVGTGIAGANAVRDFKITRFGGTARFFINGVLVATINTNVPVTGMTSMVVVVTQEAVAKNIVVNTFKVWQAR